MHLGILHLHIQCGLRETSVLPRWCRRGWLLGLCSLRSANDCDNNSYTTTALCGYYYTVSGPITSLTSTTNKFNPFHIFCLLSHCCVIPRLQWTRRSCYRRIVSCLSLVPRHHVSRILCKESIVDLIVVRSMPAETSAFRLLMGIRTCCAEIRIEGFGIKELLKMRKLS